MSPGNLAWQISLAFQGRWCICSRTFGQRAILASYEPQHGPKGAVRGLPRKRPSVGGIRVQEQGVRNGAYGADKFGFKNLAEVRWNLTEPSLYEHAISAGEASLVAGGALCAETGHHTGRSPKDKHTVVDALTRDSVWWDGNRKITPENFQRHYDDFIAHARGKTLYAQDLYGGADPNYRIKTRVFTELAWHSLFIRQLLIRPVEPELEDFVPELTIVD